MRKLELFSLCVIVALLLVVGCSFTQPQKTVVLNLAAQNCGFLLAQENLPLALEIYDFSKHILKVEPGDFTKDTFYWWIEVLMEFLKLVGSKVYESGSMSTNTGIAPLNSIAATVATAVCDTVMTSWPEPTPQATRAR